MSEIGTVITDLDMVTAYGRGVSPCWEGIAAGKSAIHNVERFSTRSFQSNNAAVVQGLTYLKGDSLVSQMLASLLKDNKALIPHDALLVLATTTGEIDLLERQVLDKAGDAAQSMLGVFLEKVKKLCGIRGEGLIVSSACASASSALGLASSLIRGGEHDCVLVVAADAVTEFVFSGFSSLMALDPDKARPFDKNRAGLSLGEAAGFILLMSRQRAEKEGRTVLGEIAGWAASSDANHMTGPSRDGSGLSIAIRNALDKAGVTSGDVGCISSHGTGTVYNDSMEMKAYNRVFEDRAIPAYSIKGAVGHTMGAAGLIETIIALRVLQEKVIPATLGLRDVDPEAKDWAATGSRPLEKNIVLLNNAGFGGVNAALVLKQKKGYPR